MFCIGICDDDEGLCGELEKMLYDYGKENKLQMNIDIWYQGESNHENAPSYARLVSKMVEAWRKDFGWDFPFYYV